MDAEGSGRLEPVFGAVVEALETLMTIASDRGRGFPAVNGLNQRTYAREG